MKRNSKKQKSDAKKERTTKNEIAEKKKYFKSKSAKESFSAESQEGSELLGAAAEGPSVTEGGEEADGNSKKSILTKSGIASVLGLDTAFDPIILGQRLLRGVILAALSFLLGRTPLLLDTYPLALSLMCSSEKSVLWILLGSLISAFTAEKAAGVFFEAAVYVPAYIMALVIRSAARVFIDPPEGFSPKMLLSKKLSREQKKRAFRLVVRSRYEENIYLRMATACVSAFLVSLYAMQAGGYRYYDLFSAMFAMISAPVITYVFCGLWVKGGDRWDKIYRSAAITALLGSGVLALRNSYVLGINAAVFFAFLSVLYISERYGAVFGSAVGLCTGLAVSPIYAPSFVLSAICAGVMKGRSRFVSYSAAVGIAMLWGVYIDGTGALLSLMPSFLAASVVAMGADMFVLLPKEKAKEEALPAEENSKAPEGAEARLEALSETLSDLASALYGISDRIRTPGMTEVRELCLYAFEDVCKLCENREKCRSCYSEFSQCVTEIAEITTRDGRVRMGAIPEHINGFCCMMPVVVNKVNARYAELVERRITGEKTELIALDYEALSHIIADTLAGIRRENEIDAELSRRLRHFGSRKDIGLGEIYAVGDERKRIYCRSMSRKAEEIGADELRAELERVCGFPLKPLVFELHDRKIALRTEARKCFSAEAAIACLPARGEAVSGDRAITFENSRDKRYAIISDGMGSGQSAAFTSEMCGVFLEKMLLGGNKKETSVKMLNNLLRSKGEECSATVDLMELDLISGKASFIKSGAAPSFVKRGDKLYKLRSSTAPIGIMRGIDAEQVRFDTEDGDIIVMLSDGVGDGQLPEESFWLMEILGQELGDVSLAGLAERLCNKAVEMGSTDDVSVLLIKVKKTKEDD